MTVARPRGELSAAGPEGPAAPATGGTQKGFRGGTERAATPAATLERIRPLFDRLGITRIADVTGLDRIGIPVVAVHRPNSRSLAVAQGKGATLEEAKVSGAMESIETYHAENVVAPLFLGSYREMRARHPVVVVDRLPRLTVSRFGPDVPLLWMVGTELASGAKTLLPYELVHLDFRLPLPTGSGAFVMGSNGLASGNELVEAIVHGLYEVIERDANTLWHLSGDESQRARRLDLGTVQDGRCRAVLERFDAARIETIVWETTTDVGVSSFLCTVVDRDPDEPWPTTPISGSGCHASRDIALLRALTEAAQGRLTLISGARDDLAQTSFDLATARHRSRVVRALGAASLATRSFEEAPDASNETFEEDLNRALAALTRVGLDQIVVANLTRPELGIPVVRVVVPGLETMSELPGFVPGRRAAAAGAGRQR